MQIAEIPAAFSFIESRVDNKMCILRELFSAFLLISLLQIDDPSNVLEEGTEEDGGRYSNPLPQPLPANVCVCVSLLKRSSLART